jgi:hypothetical protein
VRFLGKTGRKDSFAAAKAYLLQVCMKSQLDKPFLDPELIMGNMRVRGMQVAPHVRYAEAFKGRLLV